MVNDDKPRPAPSSEHIEALRRASYALEELIIAIDGKLVISGPVAELEKLFLWKDQARAALRACFHSR